jgi:hypothetical protein
MHDDDGWVENEASSKIRSGWKKKRAWGKLNDESADSYILDT